jgi:Cation transport ATPase
VRKGECNAKVIATGKRTYYGKATELVSVAKPKLHMEEVTAKIVNYLLLIVVVLLGLMFHFSYIRREDLLNVIPLALVLIVFAVPVALPTMFTISLAIGSMETAKKGALLTRLNAMEDAATIDTL